MKTFSIIALACLMTVVLTAQENTGKIREVGVGFANLNSFSLQYRWGTEHLLFRVTGTLGGYSSTGKSSIENKNINDINTNTSSQTSDQTTPVSVNAGLNFAALKLIGFNDKVGFLCGGFLGFSYSNLTTNSSGTQSNSNSTSSPIFDLPPTTFDNSNMNQTLQPYVGVAIGAYYKINSSFIIYGELDPNIYYAMNSSKVTSESVSYSGTSSNPIRQTVNREQKDNSNNIGVSGISNGGASLTLVYRFKK